MAPMPTIKTGKPDTSYLYVEADSGDSSPTPSSPPSSADPPKSQCSSLSDGESFEGYGENEGGGGGLLNINNHINNNGSLDHSSNASSNDGNNNLNAITGVQLELAPHGNSTPHHDDELNIIPRDNWARTSLRRMPASNPDSLPNRRWGSMRHSGRRQLGSNALASQLYRSSSFNSSGRSSNCDTTEDMYSDVSLDNVQDLNYKVSPTNCLTYVNYLYKKSAEL